MRRTRSSGVSIENFEDVELHRIDPKNRDSSHVVTAEELYNEEVQVNSIAAAYFFGKGTVEFSESVKKDAQGLGLLK